MIKVETIITSDTKNGVIKSLPAAGNNIHNIGGLRKLEGLNSFHSSITTICFQIFT